MTPAAFVMAKPAGCWAASSGADIAKHSAVITRLLLVVACVFWTAGRALAQPANAHVEPFEAHGRFEVLLNATFGKTRPDTTVRDKHDLDQIAYLSVHLW